MELTVLPAGPVFNNARHMAAGPKAPSLPHPGGQHGPALPARDDGAPAYMCHRFPQPVPDHDAGVVLRQEVPVPAPPLAVVVTVGVQATALMHGLKALARVHEGLILRHVVRDGSGFRGPALPAAFRLAWVCVNGQDMDLPVVRECYRALRAVAPVTVSVSGPATAMLWQAGRMKRFRTA